MPDEFLSEHSNSTMDAELLEAGPSAAATAAAMAFSLQGCVAADGEFLQEPPGQAAVLVCLCACFLVALGRRGLSGRGGSNPVPSNSGTQESSGAREQGSQARSRMSAQAPPPGLLKEGWRWRRHEQEGWRPVPCAAAPPGSSALDGEPEHSAQGSSSVRKHAGMHAFLMFL